MKLKEGKRYDFLVEKIVRVGDNTYYLLRGPGDTKYLLRKKYYKHYDIQLNNIINCRVDKINCRGEVFLEPENPYYKEGDEYDFRVIGKEVRVNESGEVIPVLLVLDKFSTELVVPMSIIGTYDVLNSDHIRLRIRSISKGRILFKDTGNDEEGEHEEEDAVYEFLIYDKMTGVDGKDYFLVSDHNNSNYIIPAEQYSYYGLDKGRTFSGRYIKYHDSEQYKIEPLNPHYTAGKKYEFKLISANDKPDGPGKILIVGDRHGLKHEVFVPSNYRLAEKLVLRVEKIRKGWPLLVPV